MSTQGAAAGGGLTSLIPLILMFAAAWFLLVRPQQKRAKEQAEMQSHLEPDTEIVTIGGIFGTIVEVGEERVRIRVADGSELEIARQAVRSVVTSADAEPDEDADAGRTLDEAEGDAAAVDEDEA